MNFVIWLIVGAIAGWVANRLMGAPNETLVINITVAIAGAVVAGGMLTPLLGISISDQGGFSFSAMLVALVGAVILLALLSLFHQRSGLLR